MKLLSKDELVAQFKRIREMDWIPTARPGNAGGVGNTLEDLLGIDENNLPLPNASEWELKCKRADSSSLGTLFHMEPSPRAIRFVPAVLLPKYGWPHEKAGIKYPTNEMSFRQTINGRSRSDRGFGIVVDKTARKVVVSFDGRAVGSNQADWVAGVKSRVGLGELNPQPYWGFDDLIHKAGTKLPNCFYVVAACRKERGIEYFKYETILMLQGFDGGHFLDALENGKILVDFDARTGHNHGTKFRVRAITDMCALYSSCREI